MKHNIKSLRKQVGFTLVEIAIVLVIIGLLLGGVLKGQEMIENARIKAVVGDMNGIGAAYASYVDRYRAVPGDETAAAMTARGWPGGATGGNANGRLDTAPADTFTNIVIEQASMWRALRGSGLASGDAAAPVGPGSLPTTSSGGLIGVSMRAYGLPGVTVCASGLTAKQAAGIDAAVDGASRVGSGNANGSVRGFGSTTVNPLPPAAVAPGNAGFNDATAGALWTMCRSI
ncbi:MAG: prepilin-type N-terminal cleavage/methylation domain-containing protein [Telluria sp.]